MTRGTLLLLSVCLLLATSLIGVDAWFPSNSIPSKCSLGACDTATLDSGASANVVVTAVGADSDPNRHFDVTVTTNGLTKGGVTGVFVGFKYSIYSGPMVPLTKYVVKNSPAVTGVTYDSSYGHGDNAIGTCSGRVFQIIVETKAAKSVTFSIYPPANSDTDFRDLHYGVRITGGTTSKCAKETIFNFECGAKCTGTPPPPPPPVVPPPVVCKLGACDRNTADSLVGANITVVTVGGSNDPYKHYQITATTLGLSFGYIAGVYIGFTWSTPVGTPMTYDSHNFAINNSPDIIGVHYDSNYGGLVNNQHNALPQCSGRAYEIVADTVPGKNVVTFNVYPPPNVNVDFTTGMHFGLRVNDGIGWNLTCAALPFQFECGALPPPPWTPDYTQCACGLDQVIIDCDDKIPLGLTGDERAKCIVRLDPPLGDWCLCEITVDLSTSIVNPTGAPMFAEGNFVTFTAGGPSEFILHVDTAATTPVGNVTLDCPVRTGPHECLSTCNSTSFEIIPAGGSYVELAECLDVGKTVSAVMTLSHPAPEQGWAVDVTITQGTAAGGAPAACAVSPSTHLVVPAGQSTLNFGIKCTAAGDIYVSYKAVGVTAGFLIPYHGHTYSVKASCSGVPPPPPCVLPPPICKKSQPNGMKGLNGYGGTCMLETCGKDKSSSSTSLVSVTPVGDHFHVVVSTVDTKSKLDIRQIALTWKSIGDGKHFASKEFTVAGSKGLVTGVYYDRKGVPGEVPVVGCECHTTYNMIVNIGTDNDQKTYNHVEFDLLPPTGALIDLSTASFAVRGEVASTTGSRHSCRRFSSVRLSCNACDGQDGGDDNDDCVDQCPAPLITCPDDPSKCRLKLADCKLPTCKPKKDDDKNKKNKRWPF